MDYRSETIDLLRRRAAMFTNFGTDFFLLEANSANVSTYLPKVIKVDGACVLLCSGGVGTITINCTPTPIGEGKLLFLAFGDSVESLVPDSTSFDCYCLFLTPAFINKFNINLNAIDYRPINETDRKSMQLTPEQLSLMKEHFKMLALSTSANTVENPFTRNIAQSLITAIIFQILEFSSANSMGTSGSRSRGNSYVNDFMHLLRAHFTTERSMSFYADKLCISPKYLSLIVKEATGMTATEWIDRIVILEAKNLLRYSGKNIQQIAYALNFRNQSAFGKFFKNQTGSSPSEFRKS